MMWHDLTVSEMASEVERCIRGRTSEPVPVDEIHRWFEDNREEVEGFALAPHAIADRILAEAE